MFQNRKEKLGKVILAFLIIVAVVSAGAVLAKNLASAEQASTAKVIAYYFHGSFRCPTCRKLEQYSREAIEINFKDALRSGKLELKVVNVEDKGNEHYASDYRLYTKSLILSSVKDGKQIKWKNLDKIWEYVGNKERLIDYVKNAVADLLKETE